MELQIFLFIFYLCKHKIICNVLDIQLLELPKSLDLVIFKGYHFIYIVWPYSSLIIWCCSSPTLVWYYTWLALRGPEIYFWFSAPFKKNESGCQSTWSKKINFQHFANIFTLSFIFGFLTIVSLLLKPALQLGRGQKYIFRSEWGNVFL